MTIIYYDYVMLSACIFKCDYSDISFCNLQFYGKHLYKQKPTIYMYMQNLLFA